MKRQDIGERLERFTEPEPNSGCFLWTGGFDSRGNPFKPYGRIWIDGRTLNAHRVAWEYHVGPIPEGMKVCHRCDTPLCINVKHLFLGTPKDNTQDMIAKGRDMPTRWSKRGERSNWNKLSESQVVAILSDQRMQRVIAADYGITQTAVSRIKLGKVWRHLWVTSTTKQESPATT